MSARLRDFLNRDSGPHILPALLECDFASLGEVAKTSQNAGAKILHLDVMDGHFVPNLTYGPALIRSLHQATPLFLDAHLMIGHPERVVDQYVKAGCDIVTIHIEAAANPAPILKAIRSLGALAGLALNPETPVSMIEPFLEYCDLVLPLSVKPGWGGQPFDPGTVEKLRWLKKHGPSTLILESDGGLNPETLPQVVAEGAQLLVVGSALFRAADFAREYARLAAITRQP